MAEIDGSQVTARGFSSASSRSSRRGRALAWATAVAMAAVPATAVADAPRVTVEYQPMVSTGLAAGQLFEAWFVLDKPLEPTAPGYAVPEGATIRFTFPKSFTPRAHEPLDAVLLYGWPQKAIKANHTVQVDAKNPRSVVVHLNEAIPASPPDRPGLKAIHLRAGVRNPAAGEYPVQVEFVDAGALSGVTKAVAHITPKPVPNIAAYNQLHEGRDEDWQHVNRGAEAGLPIDFLVTLPDRARSAISLRKAQDGLDIVADDERIGSVTVSGVAVTLEPQPFGPGFARLGIIRVRAVAGSTPGTAQIAAALRGGTRYVVHLVVE